MTRYLGKFLELNGLLLLGSGLVWGIHQKDLEGEMRMLGLGVVVFLVGHLLERRAGQRR